MVVCQLCNKEFKNERGLIVHLARTHDVRGPRGRLSVKTIYRFFPILRKRRWAKAWNFLKRNVENSVEDEWRKGYAHALKGMITALKVDHSPPKPYILKLKNYSKNQLQEAKEKFSRQTKNPPKNILETAAIMYRKAVKKHLTHGRTIQGMTVAAIYLACRQFGIVRTITELYQASGINRKEIASNYRLLVRKLNYFVPPVKTSQYITRVCNQLEVHGKTEEVAHKILKRAKKLRLTMGRGPKSIAAAASYIASTVAGERRTQREVAEATDLTEVTIRNRYKEMMKQLLIIISL